MNSSFFGRLFMPVTPLVQIVLVGDTKAQAASKGQPCKHRQR